MWQSSEVQFLRDVVRPLLVNKADTMTWVRKSSANVMKDYRLVVLRLVVILCLLHLNFGLYSDLLYDVLGKSYITEQLPPEFYDALRRRGRKKLPNVLAEACKRIDNPLVMVSLGETCVNVCPGAIYVNMKVKQLKEDILGVLFPKINTSPQVQVKTIGVESATSSCSEGKNDKPASSGLAPEQTSVIHSWFWDTLKVLKSNDRRNQNRFALDLESSEIKKCIEKVILLLTGATNAQNCNTSMLDELKQLASALILSEVNPEGSLAGIGQLVEKVLLRKAELETYLSMIVKMYDMELGGELLETGIASQGGSDGEETDSKVDKGNAEVPEAAVSSERQSNGQVNQNKKKGNKNARKTRARKNSSITWKYCSSYFLYHVCFVYAETHGAWVKLCFSFFFLSELLSIHQNLK